MNKPKEMLNKAKDLLKTQFGSDATVMAAIAIIIFIISLGLNYVINYLNGPVTNKNIYYNFEYIYSNNAVADENTEWNSATYVSPISKEKTGNYIHLRTTLKASDKDRNIIIKTDHAPIKVSVNQKDVYNNWYKTADYVGNNYNSINIPASNSETTVKISARLPFSPVMQISLNEGKAKSFVLTPWIAVSLLALTASAIALILSIAMLFGKRKRLFNLIIALYLIAFSLFSVLSSLADSTYSFNSPKIYGANIISAFVLQSLILIMIARLFKISLKTNVFFLSVGLISALVNIVIHTPTVYKTTLIIQYASLLISALILVSQGRKLLSIRIKNAKAMNVILNYLSISFIAALIILLINNNRTVLGSFPFIYSFVALGFIIFCYASSLYFEQNISKTEEKMQLYDKCIEKIPELIKNIAYEKNVNAIYKYVTECICDICRAFLSKEDDLNLSYCVAEKEPDCYNVIISEKITQTPNFKLIEDRHKATGKPCFFSETYFCLIFRNPDEIEAIMYFEGINGILSSFFIKAIQTLYTVSNLFITGWKNSDNEINEQEVFVNLAKVVESSTGSNETHVDKVAEYTRLILKEMGYPDSTCDMVANAGALHDIGKIAIPDEITGKRGLLSEKERSIMNKHIDYGRDILGSIQTEFMKTAATIAYEHHEHFDGQGYNKKAGEEINIFSRVVSVADVFDALTKKRSYKEAWSREEAIEFIKQDSGKKFDPKVVEAFQRVISKKKEEERE